MLKTALRNVLSHKLRLGLSFVAVVLSVAFVAGSLIFTDTLGKSFRDLFTQISPDVTVSKATNFSNSFDAGATAVVPQSVVDTIKGIDGADVVEPQVNVQGVQIVGSNGKVIGTAGPPALGGDFSDTEGISPLKLVEGHAPQGPDQVVIDQSSVEKGKLQVGQPVKIVMPSGPPVEPTLVGVVRYGETGNLAGATFTGWEAASAQQLLLHDDTWSAVAVRADDGVSDATLKKRIADALPAGYDVRTSAEQAEEAASDIEQGLSFLNVFLLVFAGVAVFVGSFIILNTFSMLVAQRTRELALLRAVGASRAQVTRSVLVEALIVGFVGATAGIGVGIGLASLLKALFGAFGLELGSTPFVFAPRTFLWSYAVGLIVTSVAAYFPARKAAKVPPVAAMRDDVTMQPRGLRLRATVGALITGVGIVALVAGLLAGGSTAASLVGVAAVLVLIGVAVLSPVLSRPIVGGLSVLYPKLFGTVGRLSRDNARRNPRRTAATASALMIGLALVGSMGTLAASTKASIDKLVDSALGADFVVSNPAQIGFSTAVTDDVRSVDGVQAVNVQRFGQAKLDGKSIFISATDPGTLSTAVAIDFVAGSAKGLEGNGLLVDESTAKSNGWQVGDTARLQMATGETEVTVGGIYKVNPAQGAYLTSLHAWEAAGGPKSDNMLFIDTAPGTDLSTMETRLDKALADFPNVSVADRAEFKDQQRSGIDQVLAIIYALLGLSIIIAVLGIINTLVLSVIERTREIGLLRAVGMVRSQLWRMVTLEAVVISVFGALLGLVVGVGFGTALQQSLVGQGVEVLSIPFGLLIGFLVASGVVGVLAALWPTWRATRIDVLRAITTD
jgi:putative ABC transport system permease protein